MTPDTTPDTTPAGGAAPETLRTLETEVRTALRRAGLRCLDEPSPDAAPGGGDAGGVRIDADTDLLIAWSAPRALKEEARAALRRQDTDDPAYRLFGAAGEAMSVALLQILSTAGFQASMFAGTPYVVQVTP